MGVIDDLKTLETTDAYPEFSFAITVIIRLTIFVMRLKPESMNES